MKRVFAVVAGLLFVGRAFAGDFTVTGRILMPDNSVAAGALAVSGQTIAAVGATATGGPAAIDVGDAVILPGFIDLHNHLTWNVLPRWLPGRNFASRYEWQDAAEYDRLLVSPHNVAMNAAACEAALYAEVKALIGGATSTIGSLYNNADHPNNADCAKGLARNLDLASGLGFKPPASPDSCGTSDKIADMVAYEIFPLELPHARFDYLLCELGNGTLRSLVIHLSEGSANDSSAHREFTMLDKARLLRPGVVIVHGTALRAPDFKAMKTAGAALVWSPRSNDELYGSTTNVSAAALAGVTIAIAPDWSPSGSAGMLQEMGYAARRYTAFEPAELIRMATIVPAQAARLETAIGDLSPGKKADFVVVKAKRDPKLRNPDLDPLVRATPADIALVVVGGEPLYGDPDLMQKLRPGTGLDDLSVCGAPKKLYLGESYAPALKKNFAQIQDTLNAALIQAGSKLAEIECE